MLWQYNYNWASSADYLFTWAGVDPDVAISCPLASGWQFVGATFDLPTMTWRFICNGSLIAASNYIMSSTPNTTSLLLGGHRLQAGDFEVGGTTSLACVTLLGMSITTNTQVEQLKSLCEVYQAINCSPNCAPNSCRASAMSIVGYTCDSCAPGWNGTDCLSYGCIPACANGGSCISPNTCQCTNGWIGPSCSTIASLVSGLPFVGYWPFSSQFGLRDSGTHLIDAVYSNTTTGSAQVLGPFGKPNSAVQTGASINPSSYLNWTSPYINLGATSWTIVTYVRFANGSIAAPIFEYYNGPGSYASHLWHDSRTSPFIPNRLYFTSLTSWNSATNNTSPCQVSNGWQFVGIVYDMTNQTWRFFCNQSFGVANTITTPPITNDTLMGGFRAKGTGPFASKVAFACFSMLSSALNLQQLLDLKQLCYLAQNVTCGANCANGTCRFSMSNATGYTCDACLPGWAGSDCNTVACSTPCANGGTCIGLNTCQCTNGYVGATCSSILSLAMTLPPFIGYWPFSSQFGLRDSGPYQIDAVYSNSTTGSAQVVGPFGKQNSATQTSSSLSPSGYLNWTSPHLNLGATSWTMALYVKLPDVNPTPILEFYNGQSVYSSHLWHNTLASPYVPNYLFFNPMTDFNPITNNSSPCSLTNGWQFIAIVYDHVAHSWTPFCNESFGVTNPQVAPPLTNDTLMGGFRSVGGGFAKQVAFACFSIFSGTLSAQQLLDAKQLCYLAQNVTCGPNCVNNTCRFSASGTSGYKCDACLPAWAGSDCNTAGCATQPCLNGGTCIGTNNCTCPANYTGSQCQNVVCSPPCQNGGNCTSAGNACNCTHQWTDPTCTTPICVLGCANAGTCIAPDVCSCPTGWTGTTCTTPTCTPSCANGGSCTAVNSCTCTTQWTGGNCTTPVCNPACLNGGTCVSPDVCSCPTSTYIGAICQYPVCNPACPVGYFCNAPNQCINTGASLCDLVKTDLGPVCSNWSKAGQCLSNPGFMWTSCMSTCTKWATCECSVTIPNTPVDSNCTCGEMAASGLCESDSTIASNCTYTCGRRSNPSNNCSTYPLEVTLPIHASWTLGPPPPSYFYGHGAFMQTALVTCDVGYTADFPEKTGMHVCDPFTPNATTGNWAVINTALPTCLEAPCPDPPYIEGSYVVNTTTKDEFFAGDKVTYYCKSGLNMRYAIVPEATCTFTGPTGWTWADNKPQCMFPPCNALVEGINTYANVSTNQTGGIATYSCLLGYNPTVDADLFVKTCQHGGSWTPVGKPVCAVVKCGDPPLEENSYLTGLQSSYVYGDTVTTRCTTGSTSLYIEPETESTPLASVTNYCTEFGTWSRNLLSCLLVQCAAPQSFEISNYRILNSTSDLQNLLYGMVIAFECDWNQGYEPDKNQTSIYGYWKCNENSTWDREPLYCVQSALMKIIKPKKQEAYESSTAVAAASSVLAVLAFFLGVIVCLDYMTLSRDLKRLRHNLRHFFRRLRDQARLKELHEKRKQLRHQLDKERYLEQVDAIKEQQQLAAAGFAVNDVDGDVTEFASVLQQRASSWATRPMTADNFARLNNRHDHVEGEMDVPEDIHCHLDGGNSSSSHKTSTRTLTAR